jgi:ATP:corrinoid adenosyltransferase
MSIRNDLNIYQRVQNKKIARYKTDEYDEKNCLVKNRITTNLYPQQEFVQNYIMDPKVRGLLVYHGLGSGKTCASISAAISAQNKGRSIYVFVPAFLKNNFMGEIRSCTPRGTQLTLSSSHVFSYNSSKVRQHVFDFFGIENESMSDLVSKMENSMIIVDEAHHIILHIHNAIVHDKRDSVGYFFYELFMSLKNTKIVLLTGTPLTNFAYESAVIANILVGYKNGKSTIFPQSPDVFYREYIDEKTASIKPSMKSDFARRFTGLITYFPTIENDIVFPVIKQHQTIDCVMKSDQLSLYSDYVEDEQEEMKRRAMKARIDKEVNSTFRVYSRMASNFVFPDEFIEQFIQKSNILTPSEKGVMNQHNLLSFKNFRRIVLTHGNPREARARYKKIYNDLIDEFTKEYAKYMNLTNVHHFSTKYAQMINTLQKRGKKVIYSFFKNYAGTQSLEWFLDMIGYEKVEITNAPEIDEFTDIIIDNNNNDNKTNKRKDNNDLILINNHNNNKNETLKNVDISKSKKRYIVFSGSQVAKRKILELYNDPRNKEGDFIDILIISSAGSEGINLKDVRHVHILEPYWNESRSQQVIGRARRLCSHQNLPQSKRNVSIYSYIAINQNNMPLSTDEIIALLAQKKQKILDEIYVIFQEMAIDCFLTKNPRCYSYTMIKNSKNTINKKYKHWYGYYKNDKRDIANISQVSVEKKFTFVPFQNTNKFVIGRDKQSGLYYIFAFDGKNYSEYGLLGNPNTDDQMYLYLNRGGKYVKSNTYYLLKDIQKQIYNPNVSG